MAHSVPEENVTRDNKPHNYSSHIKQTLKQKHSPINDEFVFLNPSRIYFTSEVEYFW